MDRATFLRRSAAGAAVLAFPGLARGTGGTKIASLRAAVRGPVLTSASAGYDAARQVFDAAYSSVRPLAVVLPLDAKDVAAVVRWAATHGEHIVAKSGGHSYAGYSTTTGVVVDLSRLAGISVAPGRATIGAGARLGNIYDRLNAHGAAIPAGSCPTVGIGGHVLGGGFGLASRAWGLASDNLVSLHVVTADGTARVVDAHHDPDLFWACRGGGGGNFGIATSFTFRTHAVSQGAYFVGTWPWSQVEDVVASFLEWAPKQPDALGAICRLAGPATAPTVQVFGQFLGSVAGLTAALASLTPPAAKLTIAPSSWLDLVRRWAGCLSHTLPQCAVPVPQSFAGASDYVATQPSTVQLARFREAVEQPGPQGGSLLLDAYGGAVSRVAPAATAFVHRQRLASIQYFAAGPGGPARAWVDGARALLRPAVSGEAYVNYVDPHLASWQHAYYGANLARLRHVKKAVDPHGLFRFPQSIPPA